jgi:hypothetical protein
VTEFAEAVTLMETRVGFADVELLSPDLAVAPHPVSTILTRRVNQMLPPNFFITKTSKTSSVKLKSG